MTLVIELLGGPMDGQRCEINNATAIEMRFQSASDFPGRVVYPGTNLFPVPNPEHVYRVDGNTATYEGLKGAT